MELRMDAIVMQSKESYLEGFDRFEKGSLLNDPGWLRSIRRAAILKFYELGFPTIQDEDWRFTNVAPIARTPFKMAENGHEKIDPQELSRSMFFGLEFSRLVFVNGQYSPSLSSIRFSVDGLKIGGLSHALAEERDLLERHLCRYADFQRDAFLALNTAFLKDGAFIYIPRGAILDEPIYLLFVSSATHSPAITHPRNLIVLEDNSQATIIEDYVSLADDVYFSNSVTEVLVGENSVLSHYMIERESKKAFNVSTVRFQQSRSSNVTLHSVLLGGALVRSNVHPVMVGEGSECMINGLYMPTGRQHMDNYMRVEHASPHCDSRQLYKGILDGRSHAVFHGRIIVHKDAQKTDAKQTNKNLLLSDEAQIDTKPQLEIYADDVKCTHGATIGQIDQNAIFYLRSRGIDEEASRALLLLAFASESLERMRVEPIRRGLEEVVTKRFSQGRHLDNVL
jgi:Fe-S cluster assembly protein SufD